MKYPDRVQEIINTLADMHPELVHGDDEARRSLTMLFAQQCCFELGSEWGTKKSSTSSPLSADVVAFTDGFIFVGWDTQIAGGIIAQFPDSINLTGQVFVAVDPVNHLEFPNTMPPENKCPNDYDDAMAVRWGRCITSMAAKGTNEIPMFKLTDDPGQVQLFAMRCQADWQAGRLSQNDSILKHINEFRAECKVPPWTSLPEV
jgi:hypothetical protein